MTPSRRIPGKPSNVSPITWIVGSVAILYFARQVFIPFAAALTLTFLLAPAVMWLQRFRLSRLQAVIVVIILAAVAAGALGWKITGQLLSVLTELPNYQQNIHNKIEALRSPQKGPLEKVSQTVKGISEELSTAEVAPNPPVGPNLPGKAVVNSPPGVSQVQVVESPKN